MDHNKAAYNFIKDNNGIKLVKGILFNMFVHTDFLEKFTPKYNIALNGSRGFEEGHTNLGKRGVVWWEATLETAHDANNEVVGVSYILRDVTDRKMKEQKILEQNTSLLKIAHWQSHQFRAPLTTIIGMVDLIKLEKNSAPDEYFFLLGNAVSNLDQNIKEIVNNADNHNLFNDPVPNVQNQLG